MFESWIMKSEMQSHDFEKLTDIMEEWEVLPKEEFKAIAKELGAPIKNLKYVSTTSEHDGPSEEYFAVSEVFWEGNEGFGENDLIQKNLKHCWILINEKAEIVRFTKSVRDGVHLHGFIFLQ